MPRRNGKTKPVCEAAATGRTLELFGEVKKALGLPYVPGIVQIYAASPPFLELLWEQVAPALGRQAFFRLADRLRASAYTRVHSYFAVPDLCARITGLGFSEGARQELTETVGLFHYANAPLLLLVSAAQQAFDAPVGIDSPESGAATPPPPRPRPVLVAEEDAGPRVGKIFEELKQALSAPMVSVDFRALARFPDFLAEYWRALKPMVASPLYTESLYGLCETAMALARELPARLDLRKDRLESAGLDDDSIAAVVRVSEQFTKVLSGIALNVAAAKIGLEGGTARGRQPEPAPSTEETQAA